MNALVRWSCLSLALCALPACTEADRPSSLPTQRFDVVIPPSDAVMPTRDVVTMVDAGAPFDATDATPSIRDVSLDLSVNRPYPPPPYGGSVGAAPPPFTLPDCMGMPYSFGGPAFLQSRATVLALFTGTCPSCEADARSLQGLSTEFAARGVRVVEVLLEGAAPMEQPSGTFCAQWRMRAGVTHPVLLDVSRTLDVINPVPRAFPLVLVIDGSGIIRGRFAMDRDWVTAARAVLMMFTS